MATQNPLTDNLEATEVHAPAHISQDSDSEHPAKVITNSRKHNIYTPLPFKGPIVPFGALVEYHPSSQKDHARIHQFGKKVLPGIFLGYDEIVGRIWKRRYSEADLENLESWMRQTFLLEEHQKF